MEVQSLTTTLRMEKLENILHRIQEIMKEMKIYVTSHHENTESVNHYKTNGIKLALTLADIAPEKIAENQIMISYLETMSGKGTGGLPGEIIKFKDKKDTLLNHFIGILSSFLVGGNVSAAQQDLHQLLEPILGKGMIEKRKSQSQGEDVVLQQPDRNNRLYQLIKQEIKKLPKEIKESIGRAITNNGLDGKEHPDYAGYLENKLIVKEYEAQREVLGQIFENAFLDISLHLKDCRRSGHRPTDLSHDEIKSIVLAAFQNGVLTTAGEQYPEIKQLHTHINTSVLDIFAHNSSKNITHIPLSSYTKLPKIFSDAWKAIVEMEIMGQTFIEYAIIRALELTNKEFLNAGKVRFQGEKQPLTVGLINGEISWKIGKSYHLDHNSAVTLLQNSEIENKEGDRINLLIYQDIFSFIPTPLGNVYHIGSERGIRECISTIFGERLQIKDIPLDQICKLQNEMAIHRVVGDEPEDYTMGNQAQFTHAPIAISTAAPSLNTIVRYRYPSELVMKTLEYPTGLHFPSEQQELEWLANKHFNNIYSV